MRSSLSRQTKSATQEKFKKSGSQEYPPSLKISRAAGGVQERIVWPAPGSEEDTELGVLMELEVGHGETEVHAGVQA
jgi:hypothetical protein